MDVLPDDVLLEIFYFYVDKSPSHDDIPSRVSKRAIEAWQSLVHVCQRWRSLVLGSPRRFNLRLYCTYKTPIKDRMDVWPALPLVVDSRDIIGGDNIIAALGHSNRICQANVDLQVGGQKFEAVLVAMQVPFPELTDLRVSSFGTKPPTIPDSFLGGSALSLKSFKLDGTPFPGLPKLRLSATHLVELRLLNIPRSGYVSPESVVTIISVLSGLRIFSLDFRFRQSRPASGWQNPGQPLPKRSILPSLDTFHYNGVSGYLEDLVTRIDTPQLDEMQIVFSDKMDFDCAQLAQLINRSPTLRIRDRAHLQFNILDVASVVLLSRRSRPIRIVILCASGGPGPQLSTLAQVWNTPLDPLSMVEDLYILHRYREMVWKNDAIEKAMWLRLLLPFTSVKNLYLSKKSAPGIATALQDLVGGGITEVLPSLQNIFVDRLEPSGPFPENIEQFVAARQLFNRPVAITFLQKDLCEKTTLSLL